MLETHLLDTLCEATNWGLMRHSQLTGQTTFGEEIDETHFGVWRVREGIWRGRSETSEGILKKGRGEENCV